MKINANQGAQKQKKMTSQGAQRQEGTNVQPGSWTKHQTDQANKGT